MPGPSAAYYASIEPSPRDRRLVLASGTVLALAGILPVLTFDVSPALRAMATCAWLLFSGLELAHMARAFAHAAGFRLDETLFLEVRDSHGRWLPGKVLAGSIVLEEAIWLRYRNNEGGISAELITGNGRSAHNFRRLKVLLLLGETAQKR